MDQEYWQNKWEKGETGWDIKNVSTPIASYLDQYEDKDAKILVPGGGASYEANYAFENGFDNIFVVDFSKKAKELFLKRFPKFPQDQYLVEDFFNLQEEFDLILEQTFFCALSPSRRLSYMKKMHNLLKFSGQLAGLLFTFPLTEQGPPFGGNEKMYRELMEPLFKIQTLEACYNSIPPRMGNELFFICSKK